MIPTIPTPPSDFVSNIASTSAGLLSSYSNYVYFIVGILMVAAIIGIFVNYLKH